MTELAKHVAGRPDGQERLFPDRFSSKKWNRVREQVKLAGLIFQVLRKIFASLFAQTGVEWDCRTPARPYHLWPVTGTTPGATRSG
jgi:hypothetical protein